MSKRYLLVATCAFGALTLAACGSSSKVSTATTTVAPPTATTAAPATAATPATATTTTVIGPTTTGSPGSTGGALFTTGPVPTVTGGTDLTKEPVVAAGATPAPTVLTGQDLVVGTGATAIGSDTVNVQYVGALYSTGKVFDASWTDNGPATFPLSGVIPGFKDAIIGMKVGGRREIVIPPAFGYGAAGQPPSIPGNATLIFVIDLLAVSP